jgi:hypothetical protein
MGPTIWGPSGSMCVVIRDDLEARKTICSVAHTSASALLVRRTIWVIYFNSAHDGVFKLLITTNFFLWCIMPSLRRSEAIGAELIDDVFDALLDPSCAMALLQMHGLTKAALPNRKVCSTSGKSHPESFAFGIWV